jgi:hypothetical protein
MKKLLATLLFLPTLILVSSSAHSFWNDKWSGWVYPDKNDLTKYTKIGTEFSSLEDCRGQCKKTIASAGYPNADYECDLNCKPMNSNDPNSVMICKKTLR